MGFDFETADKLTLELVMIADETIGTVLSVLIVVSSATKVVREKTKYLSVIVLPLPPNPTLTDNNPVAFVEMTVV